MELIYAYTRRQALEDGVLIDVTEMAKEAGFKVHTVITDALHNTLEVSEEAPAGQSYEGRLWDVLNVLLFTIKFSGRDDDRVNFKVDINEAESRPSRTLQLRSVCGPDDDGNPCVTIGYPSDF